MKMCCKYWCFCFDLKTGAYVIAYLSLVLFAVAHVLAGIWFLYIVVPLVIFGKPEIIIWVFIDAVVNLVCTIIIMYYTTILLYGLHGNKPKLVKKYIWLATAFLLLNIIEFILLIIVARYLVILNPRVIFDIVFGIYTLLVIASYDKLSSTNEETTVNLVQQRQEYV